MKYPYIVNKNGVIYPAGAEVPEDISPKKATSDNQSDKKPKNKSEINRLSTAELQKLALENGIDGANDMTGAGLKKVLIEKFGL